MSYRHVDVVREGRLTIVTIDRPEARNALNAEAQREMAAAFDAFAADDDQWVAIVTGAGDRAFCAGHDLRQQAESGDMFTPRSGFGGLTARFDLDKPVIAAVNGGAFGGGFEIVLACDVAVAHSRAVFALPEPRVGIAALAGGIQRLPQVAGMKHARGMLLTGRHVGAEEALRLGIVNEVIAGDVVDAARVWAQQMLTCSPLSLRATKAALRMAEGAPVERAMAEQWSSPAMQAMLGSADFVEGPAAFAAKRAPQWQGR
jgi:crotonobetainyl-CoA hydratase